ncbi:hypothetical protein RRG08_033057 [Elysia crispata]|uniref:Tetraspanin n=1 Tax=Elysia crispata TaxID=231223 RepID=A0AAE1DTF2_9GAST|nr:hypothetical protein RRG08_033057 [Elysia crispata]
MAARELKVFAAFVNVLLISAGGGLVAVGVNALLDNHGMIQLNRISSDGVYTDISSPGLLDVASVMAIVCGCLNFFMALHGFFILCREWRCSLALYIAGLIVVALLEMAIMATAIVFTYRVDDHLYNATYMGVKEQFEGHIVTDNKFSKAFDEAQVEFECCGLDNYTDFAIYSSSWLDKDSLQVPKTCCVLDKDEYFEENRYVFSDISCAREPTVQTAHTRKACFSSIKDWLEKTVYLIFGMSIVGAAAKLLGVMITVCLIRDIGASKDPK